MNIDTWAENLTKEFYSIWEKEYSFWAPAFKIFYSKPTQNPKLMIISYQPGGNEESFKNEDKDSFEKGLFEIKGNIFIEAKHIMARNAQRFFDFDGGLEILRNSVIFPLIFFRAQSVPFWKKEIPKDIRVEMEQLSFEKVREIIDVLNPEKILVIGISTYQELKTVIGSVNNERVLHTRKEGKEKMAMIAEWGNKKIFAVTHITGTRISNADWNILKNLFVKWFS